MLLSCLMCEERAGQAEDDVACSLICDARCFLFPGTSSASRLMVLVSFALLASGFWWTVFFLTCFFRLASAFTVLPAKYALYSVVHCLIPLNCPYLNPQGFCLVVGVFVCFIVGLWVHFLFVCLFLYEQTMLELSQLSWVKTLTSDKTKFMFQLGIQTGLSTSNAFTVSLKVFSPSTSSMLCLQCKRFSIMVIPYSQNLNLSNLSFSQINLVQMVKL